MGHAGYVQNNNKKFKNINYISLHFLLIFICVLMKKFLVGNSVFGNVVKEVKKTSVHSFKKVRTFFRGIPLFLYIANYQTLTNVQKKTTKNSSKYRPIRQIYGKPDRYLKRK